MKTLLLTIACFISLAAKTQVFVTADPVFFKFGALYNYKVDRIGFYGRAQYGKIEIKDFSTNHIKIGSGISIPVGEGGVVYTGLNYNYFFNTVDNSYTIDLNRVKIVSLDIGMSLTTGRFTMLMITDPLNWESLIGFSYRLKKSTTP